MNFVILSPGMAHDGNTLKQRSLGGSETAAIQLAEAFARQKDPFGRENRVVVFSPCMEQVNVNNVIYLPIQSAQAFCQGSDVDVLIVSRALEFLTKPLNAKVTFLWCHDLALKRSEAMLRGVIYQVDRILLMSQFQKKQFMEVYSLPDSSIEVIRNGIDPSLFPKLKGAEDRHKGVMIYAARPERGLENLVRPEGIMDQLAKVLPEVKLMVAHYDNTTEQMKPYYEMLWRRCSEMKNVKLLGSLTKEQLYDLYSRSWAYIYPTPSRVSPEFDEISCISAMEAQACGLPFICSARGALPETVAEGTGILIEGDGHTEESTEKFVAAIKDLFGDDPRWQELSEAAHRHGETLSWDPVAKQIVVLADRILGEKSADPVALYKHFYRMSDIGMCRLMEEEFSFKKSEGRERFLAGTEAERQSVASGWRFTDSPALYREQYIKVDEGASIKHYESSENEPRWETVKNFLAQHGKRYKKVLDYGCWIGHQTIRMANMMPQAEVVGVDVTPRNIELAEECKKEHAKEGNVRFHVYDEMDRSILPAFKDFDLVFLNEVLEHVLNPDTLITHVETLCRQGGTIFLTTPYGPWEAMSYDTFPYRCHLRHYEMNDLLDLFGGKRDIKVFFRQTGEDNFGTPIGHHYIIYTNDEARGTGEINVERKMKWQAPRETLSVCMIAHNAESMLHRTLKSVSGLASEIIVAVDPKTTDSTAEIARKYGAKVIDGTNPMEVGFDESRNHSIAQAKGNWILWIDADEELLQPDKVAKYLRRNLLNAYALQQHHLSVDPPMNLKPDLPMRLFRNGKGIRFYGFVHEHPETELNKGVGYALVLSDTWIAHDGYLTEDVRRKRFLRNIDLVMNDRKKYPERILGKFLWLRDLVHLCRYRMESLQNGAGPFLDPQVMAWAQEASDLFEKNYIENPYDPMAADAIAYYSEANRLMGRGIPAKFVVAIEGQPPKELICQFPNSEKAATFMSALTKAVLSPLEGKYI